MITLNRPEQHNTVTPTMFETLPDLLEDVGARSEVRSVVLTGAGNAFCSGADLGQLSSATGRAGAAELRGRARAVEVLAALPQVTIAAVNGSCAGLGLALAAACDLRVAAGSAFFMSGYLRIGMPGDFGGLWFLTRTLGPARALDWYLRPRRISADEASRAGFLTAVVPDDEFGSSVEELATGLARPPIGALRAIKANATDAGRLDLAAYLDQESARHVACRSSAESRQAVADFLAARDTRPGA